MLRDFRVSELRILLKSVIPSIFRNNIILDTCTCDRFLSVITQIYEYKGAIPLDTKQGETQVGYLREWSLTSLAQNVKKFDVLRGRLLGNHNDLVT